MSLRLPPRGEEGVFLPQSKGYAKTKARNDLDTTFLRAAMESATRRASNTAKTVGLAKRMMMGDQTTIVRSIKGLQVHFCDGGFLIGSVGMSLRASRDGGTTWQKIASIPTSFVGGFVGRCTLMQRFFRSGVGAVLPHDTEKGTWVVLAERKLFLMKVEDGSVTPFWSVLRGRRPLRRGLCVVGDYVFAGDYFSNSDRCPVRIYRISITTGVCDVLFEFPSGSTRHVHFVIYDQISGKLLVGTGDDDGECLIGTICPETGCAEWVGTGSQDWRAVSLAITDDAFYWGTDNHLGHNRIWKLKRGERSPVLVGDVTGPVYYNSLLDNGIAFGTTVEKGEGEQDEFGRLYFVDADDRIRLIAKRKKDCWSPKYFGYGVAEFAEGCVDGRSLWVTWKGFCGGTRSDLIRPQSTDESESVV